MTTKTVEAQARSSTRAPRDWRKIYANRLKLTDLLVIVWAVFAAQIAWFGVTTNDVAFRGDLGELNLNYTTVSLILVFFWAVILRLNNSYGDRVVGHGSTEYKLVLNSSLSLFGLFAIVAFLLQVDFSRGYLIVAFPLGTLTLLFTRWLWRQWLDIQRDTGRFSAQVLLVGSYVTALHIARELSRQPRAGYHVVGACVPTGEIGGTLGDTGVPVVGTVDHVLAALEAGGADTVVITSSDDLPPDRIRRLSWALEPGRQHLVVAPSLTDIGGPRIHTRPVAGLPLIHVETPRYEGFKRYEKRVFDLLTSAVLIILLSPVLAVIAMIVRLSTEGPVLFRQERVGLNGSTFNMLKFRSMVVNAEEVLKSLVDQERSEGNSVLFKMRDDPRVTPIGKFLRRYSLDELPQLFNVLFGQMSLVGPRPPLQREVDLYETHVHRRFLMKPGITGLWQVSGRSDLSWEDSVRLDLYYVENWSMVGDFSILLKTARAVLHSDGAY